MVVANWPIRARSLLLLCYNKHCQAKRLCQAKRHSAAFFSKWTAPRTIKNKEKRKTFYTQGTIRENAELSPAIKTKHSRKSPHPFKVRHSNNASSLSNVDSVVGCSLKLFGSLARDFFATLPKVNMKVEISELQPGILLFVMNIATGFVISCGEVFQCSQPSSLLQR